MDSGVLALDGQRKKVGFGCFPIPESGRLAWVPLGIGRACDPNSTIAVTKKTLCIRLQLEGMYLAVGRVVAVDGEGRA